MDTSALYLPFRTGLRLVAEVDRETPGARMVVPDSVVRELSAAVRRGTPLAPAALVLARTFPIVPTRRTGDEGILDVAERLGAEVVTADRALARRLVGRGLAVHVPRDRARLLRRPGRQRPRTVKKRVPS